MRLSRHHFTIYCTALLCLLLSLPLSATTPPASDTPLQIHYTLERLEDILEKDYDKQHKINWDFKLVYHDEEVSVLLEYLKQDKKKVEKLTPEELYAFIDGIITQVHKTLKKELPIQGHIIEDDTQKSTYVFEYKSGNLDIK